MSFDLSHCEKERTGKYKIAKGKAKLGIGGGTNPFECSILSCPGR